jgi:hypothetical protein
MMHLLSFVMVILHYFRMLIICEAVHFFPSDKNEITTYLNLPPEGEYLRNVRKLSTFIGARNLRFGLVLVVGKVLSTSLTANTNWVMSGCQVHLSRLLFIPPGQVIYQNDQGNGQTGYGRFLERFGLARKKL